MARVPAYEKFHKAGVAVQLQAINGGQIVNAVSHTIGRSVTQYVEPREQPGAHGAQAAFLPGPPTTVHEQLAPGF